MAQLDLYGALRTGLIADVGLSALVGNRVYSVERPANSNESAVVYSLVSGTTEFEQGDDRSGVTDCRVQFDCIAPDTFDTAHDIFEALDDALKTMRGDHANGVRIHTVRRENFVDLSDLTGQQKTYRLTADYIIAIVED